MQTNTLQKREIFHLVFLRALIRSVPISTFVLKGGSNLRLFFGSIRYSEDMDVDASGMTLHLLRDKVMDILTSSALLDTVRTFGIERIQPPNISRAKQTETVQRFKVHLITAAGEDLSAKVEFSRRGFDSPIKSEPILPQILATYRMPPLIIPHYTALAAARQKIRTIAERRQPEARDIFDLFTLSSQPEVSTMNPAEMFSQEELILARQRIYALDYARYRDTVVSYLGSEDRTAYDSAQVWDQIRLQVVSLLERGRRDDS